VKFVDYFILFFWISLFRRIRRSYYLKDKEESQERKESQEEEA